MVILREEVVNDEAYNLSEFRDEVFTLLEMAGDALSSLELMNKGEGTPGGGDFNQYYNIIFRSLHSIKGSSAMFSLEEVVNIVHHVETLVVQKKPDGKLSAPMIEYLRKTEDKLHYILDESDIEMEFNLIDPDGDEGKEKFEEAKKIEEKMVEAKQVKEEKNKNLYQFDVPTFCQNITQFTPKVLILDDDPNIRDTMMAQIETEIENIEFIECSDPQEAIDKMIKNVPDLLIVDYFLPKYSGKEFLRNLNPIFKKLPILIITGKIVDHSLLEVMKEGADVLIEKPYNELQFKKLVRSYLEKFYYYKQLSSLIHGLKFQFTELEKKLEEAGQEKLIEDFKDNVDLLWDAKKDISKFTIA